MGDYFGNNDILVDVEKVATNYPESQRSHDESARLKEKASARAKALALKASRPR